MGDGLRLADSFPYVAVASLWYQADYSWAVFALLFVLSFLLNLGVAALVIYRRLRRRDRAE